MNTFPTLSNDQQDTADAFGMFLFSDDKEFVISGGAGVGKTSLLRYLYQSDYLENLSRLMGRNMPTNSWHFTATTNKAAGVLQEMGFEDARTIHSLLGLKVVNDFDSGITKITRDHKSTVISDSIIVIDECSMVDTVLRKLTDEGTFNCKLVYVGDHCQMAPITESISPVFSDNTPSVINEIMRSKGAPPITSLCQALRRTVETGEFFKIQHVPGFIEYLDPAQAQAKIYEHFVMNQGTTDRILHYRNEQVLGMNNWIRQQRGQSPLFTAGEQLVSNSASHSQSTMNGKRYMLSIEQEVHVEYASPIRMVNLAGYGLTYELETYTISTQYGDFDVAANPSELKACLDALKKVKNWRPFFQLKEAYADLRMREACTVYKAQGSTYKTAFVDLSDIGRCPNPAQAARMLYVACSRPTDQIYFIGTLPEKFGG